MYMSENATNQAVELIPNTTQSVENRWQVRRSLPTSRLLVTYVHVPIWIDNNSEVTDTARKAVFARLFLG